MTTVKTTMIQRGHIYKWREGCEDERFVLTVGADNRGNERLITVLMFGASGMGRDVVEIKNNLLKDTHYVHCGMVTYVNRQDLSELPLVKVSDKKMAQVNKQLCLQLDITNEETIIELDFYKRKCNELVEKLTGINIKL